MTGDRLFTKWHTSTVDGHDHAITDEVMAAGLSEECAPITAICGGLVLLTLMEEPPGERCPRCTAFLRARATLRDFEQREHHRHRKPGLVARLLHHIETPVVPRQRALAWDDRPPTPAVSPAAGTTVGAASHPRQVAPTARDET